MHDLGSRIEVARSAWTGKTIIICDGKVVGRRSAWSASTDFFRVVTQYAFTVQDHEALVEQKRSRFFAGLHPQVFSVYLDGQLVAEHKGY